MKNRLKILVLVALFGASVVMADESLVAVEGSFGTMDVDIENTLSGATLNESASFAGGGLKIGAQSDEFRIFLGANYYDVSDAKYNYIATYGAELDYLIKPSHTFDIFLGLNGGIANIEVIDENNIKRTSSDFYMGGSAGVNLHVSRSVDFEIGGRALFLDISNTRESVKYTYNTIFLGYASIIFKFNMSK